MQYRLQLTDADHHTLVRDLAAHLRIPAVPGGSTPRWVTMHASLGSQWLERGCPPWRDESSDRCSYCNRWQHRQLGCWETYLLEVDR
ncbi:MAG: hypothetical protein U9R79_05930 [Armatimonadota bacterium]|nr:hypothetical protein [Armatimonadota bacterium]